MSTIPLSTNTRVLVLTGAGVSAESGVPTFRAAGGLWEGHRVEEVASPEGFSRTASATACCSSPRTSTASTRRPAASA